MIVVIEAVKSTDEYLTATNVAVEQIEQTSLTPDGVFTTEVPLGSQYIKTGGEISPFLIEGCAPGTGDLTLIVKKDGTEICRKAVQLELHDISWFYDIWLAQVLSGERWEVEVGTTATHSQTASYQPKTDEKLLFIHGWNMQDWEKRRWTETMFKRLWWQGYKGSFGFFDWPCAMLDYFNPTCYDNSEYNAWRCGAALLDRVNQLNNGGHPGKVRLLAHSQGNVVAGEALRLATGQVVHTYVASQAAVSADLYQSGIPEYFDDYTTPDVMSTYPATTNCYFAGVTNKVPRLFSYYNESDYALHSSWFGSWEVNNEIKPDLNYHYEGSTDAYDTSAQPTPSRFYYDSLIPFDERTLAFTNDTHEIFAYAAESRAAALGIQPSINGFTTFNLVAGLLKYTDAHYSHSRQFRSNIIEEKPYWIQLLTDCQCERVLMKGEGE